MPPSSTDLRCSSPRSTVTAGPAGGARTARTTWSTEAHRSIASTRPPTIAGCRSPRRRSASTDHCSVSRSGGGRPAGPGRQGELVDPGAAFRGRHPHPDQGRLGDGRGGHRRLHHAGSHSRRDWDRPTCCCAHRVADGGGADATGAGPPIQPEPRHPARTPADPRRAHTRHSSRLAGRIVRCGRRPANAHDPARHERLQFDPVSDCASPPALKENPWTTSMSTH